MQAYWALSNLGGVSAVSYDFELYFGGKRDLTNPPTLVSGNIRFDGPDRAELDDIPQSYLHLIGRKRWLYRVHLEGQIEQDDQRRIDGWLRTIVVESKGILIDLQSDKYETPTKSGTIATAEEEAPKMGAMSFYFEDGEGFYEHGFNDVLAKIEKIFPKALPIRYGYYEPLQGKVEQGQYAEIATAFQKETDLFMKSPTPFGHIFMSIPCKKTFEKYHPRHFRRREFLLGNVKFELRRKLFENPADLSALLRLFKELCLEMNVVYAEVLQSDERDTAWLWYGIPDRKTTHTICVGPAYQEVWQEASTTGEAIGKQHRFVTTDRFGNKPPQPPFDLLAPDQKDKNPGGKPDYAPVFPFDYEFDYKKYIW